MSAHADSGVPRQRARLTQASHALYCRSGYSSSRTALSLVSAETKSAPPHSSKDVSICAALAPSNALFTTSTKGDKLLPVDPHGAYQLPDYFGPAGDLHMSTDDLATFLRAHLRAMRGEKSLISPAAEVVMHTKRMRSGLGFGVTTVAGLENVASYSGSADTFFTVIAIAAKENVAVAVSTNAAGDEAQKAVGSMLKDLLVRYATR